MERLTKSELLAIRSRLAEDLATLQLQVILGAVAAQALHINCASMSKEIRQKEELLRKIETLLNA